MTVTDLKVKIYGDGADLPAIRQKLAASGERILSKLNLKTISRETAAA